MKEEEKIVEVELEQLKEEVLMNYCEDCNLIDYYNEYTSLYLTNQYSQC